MRIAAVIVAAGRGTRAGGGEVPKQFWSIGGQPMLSRSIAAFAGHPDVALVQVVSHPADRVLYDSATAMFAAKLLPPVAGGASRQLSGLAGLEALCQHDPDGVLIHDAARPFVDAAIIQRVIDGLAHWQGCIAAVPLADTLKQAASDGGIAKTIERSGLFRAQTPQGFLFGPILDAHRKAALAQKHDFTDDAAVAEWAGMSVGLVMGSASNHKMTTTEDLAAANAAGAMPDIRTGSGFDVHRFMGGDHVMLCGVRVPHTHGVEAHSDGDVALHALTDALLGAIGAGDIGQHFPPSDTRWQGAASARFLAEAARLVRERGGRIANVDVTVLCERPRITPQRDEMRASIAKILAIAVERVSVKATTTEKLGFTGRGEGLAAMATATVMLPNAD